MSKSVFDSLELDTGMVTMPEDLSQDDNKENVKDQDTQASENSSTEESQENDQAKNTLGTETVITLDEGINADNKEPEDEAEEFENAGDVDPGLNLIYNQLKEFNLIDDIEDKGQLNEEFLRGQLPKIEEKVFLNSIENLSPDTKALLQFAFNNQGQDSVEKLQEFFNQYVEPTTIDYTSDPKEYLKDILKGAPLMSEKDIEEKLEDWEAEGVLEEKAKTAFEARKAELETQKQKQLEQAQQNRQKEIERKQQFAQEINTIVEEQKWSNERQVKFIETVRNRDQYNELISSNPQAYVQFMNFLSYFNPKTNQFDLDNWIASVATTKEAETTIKKAKQDLLSTTLSRMGSKTKSRKGSRGSDPLEVIVTPDMEQFIK